jgi:hypothetical protein
MDSTINWDIALKDLNADAKKLLTMNNGSGRNISPVIFDQTNKSGPPKFFYHILFYQLIPSH